MDGNGAVRGAARAGRGAVPQGHPREIIYHLQFVDVGGIFVTDDQIALDFARRRGILGFDTRRILEECYAVSEVGCPEAFELLQRMHALDRGVRVPANHLAVCPS